MLKRDDLARCSSFLISLTTKSTGKRDSKAEVTPPTRRRRFAEFSSQNRAGGKITAKSVGERWALRAHDRDHLP
jgi:hypothetical protein